MCREQKKIHSAASTLLVQCSLPVLLCRQFYAGAGLFQRAGRIGRGAWKSAGFSGSILLGAEIDRGRLRLFSAATAALGLLIAAACSLVLHSGRDLFTGLILIICFACSLSLNPLYIKIAGLIQKADSDLSFGLSRGVGSLAFALTALAMGALVQMLSTSIIPIAIVCTAVIQLPVLLSLHRVCAHVDLGEKRKRARLPCSPSCAPCRAFVFCC